MSIRIPHALLAAALIAGPAFAQEPSNPATSPTAPEAQPSAPEGVATPGEETPPAAAPAEEQPSANGPVATPGEETAPATPPTTEEQPAGETAPAGASDPGAAAAADPNQPGSYYAKSEHGDWVIRCIRAGQGKDPCEMYKLLEDQDDNAVAELTLIPLSNGEVAAGATLVAPLETDLIKGLGFQVDSGEMRGYPFSFCAPPGCVSRLGFTQAEVDEMKRGSTATVQLLPFGGDPENPVQLDFSLAGFTAAFDELTQYASETAPDAETPAPAQEGAAPAQ